MKVTELLESDQKMNFEVIFRLGRFKRTQAFTHKTIVNSKVLTPAEIKRILKLPVGGTLNTHFENDDGRTMVYVTRTK